MATLALPIPEPIVSVTKTLTDKGFEAYLVGGCVRDLILGKTPKDWDITTNALPEDLLSLFPHSFSNNPYGTVGVVTEDEDPTLNIVEVTPYRSEEGYSDRRRPDTVTFGVSLEEDLSRRDFTVNAIALSPTGDLIDPFGGVKDIAQGTLRAVGEPETRFNEDGLRILRGLRLSAELGFAVSQETMAAMRQKAHILEHISKERVRDELVRILLSDRPADALDTAKDLGLLPYILPDLERSIGIEQNQAHAYDVYWHLLRTMQHAADKEWGLDIRLAGLLHDISKPETRRWSPEKNDWTFHGHEVVGARVTKKILADLKFPKKQSEKIVALVRWHMFFSDPDKITLSAVRRIIRNVGEENIWDLLNLRICDRIGTGRPKEQPFRFRKYKAFVEEALRTPVSVALLKIDGKRIMDVTRETPGPKIGLVLHALLEEIIEDGSKNTPEYLESRAQELITLSFEDLKKLGDQGRARKEQEDEAGIKAIHAKHFV